MNGETQSQSPDAEQQQQPQNAPTAQQVAEQLARAQEETARLARVDACAQVGAGIRRTR